MFNRIKITTSLTILIFSFVSMHIASSFISVYRSALNDKNFSKTVALNHQIDSLTMINLDLIQSRLDTYRAAAALIENNQQQFDRDFAKAIQYLNDVQKEMQNFLSLSNPLDENIKLIEEIDYAYNQLLMDLRYQQAKLKTEGFRGYRTVDISHTQEAFSRISEQFILTVSQVLKEYDLLSAKVHYYSIIQFIIETTLLIIMLFLAIKWNTKVLKQPLHQLINHFNHIANGDLTKQVTYSGKNEIAQLFFCFQRMQKYLIETVRVVRNSSDILVEGVNSVGLKNKDLAIRTEQQSISIQQTAASMEQLNQTVKLNTSNAIEASDIANNSTQMAIKGEEITLSLACTMDKIKESAIKISSILSVIDSIAFQTNILALNAAIEATRAGELGRGFAVVAQEVRNLALRSSQAANEINLLINEANQRVALGNHLVDTTGETIRKIVNSISKVNELMAAISLASKEQSEGIDFVSQAVQEMDMTTKQNENLVNQLSYSTEILKAQSNNLIESVTLFKTN